MCGIVGYKNFTSSEDLSPSLSDAVTSLRFRGPDNQATFYDKSVGLGHTRLSIIDTSTRANQPMTDASGRYTLCFNGEIYNYRALEKELNIKMQTTSDTEVLLYLLIKEGEKCLPKLNGFFAFCFYDSIQETLLVARDRIGIKPLHYFVNKDFFAFGSELKSLLHFPIRREINHHALSSYLRFTYVPGEMSMIDGMRKLLPGQYLNLSNQEVSIHSYWKLEKQKSFSGNYDAAQRQLISLFESSVERRMIADVPLGAFLSGGTDSSAVVSMASGFNSNLNTFSIGYKDHSFFDETSYAELVATKFKTNHTTYSLTNDDLLDGLKAAVEYIDEPFADSSAIPTFILSQRVSQSMKVALSGDGADELFGGYYKHLAFAKSLSNSTLNSLMKLANPILNVLPQSRSTKFGNTVRRSSKYSNLLRMNPLQRYWYLASFNHSSNSYLLNPMVEEEMYENTKRSEVNSLNDFLDMDLQMVLPGDMLTKVDLMSMANGLEVRVPFLDKTIVDFARSLPPDFKVQGGERKRILQDAFQHILPKELYHRSKKGFEVPMLHWMKNELLAELDDYVFDRDHLEAQSIFKSTEIMDLRSKLFSRNPGDVHVIIWTIYIFQNWYRRYMA